MIDDVADEKKRGTVEEVLRLAEAGHAVELIDGEIVYKTAKAPHGNTQAHLLGVLGPFNHGSAGARGPGGWWIVTEVEALYARTEELYRHDAMGFRRDRVPDLPRDWPVRARPDWAAEILSLSTARYDLVKKQRTLHLHGVPHYWILDPQHETLTVLRHAPEAYLQILTAGIGDVVRAEPFEEVEIVVAELFGRG
jgi:Uma2 family endonuclease